MSLLVRLLSVESLVECSKIFQGRAEHSSKLLSFRTKKAKNDACDERKVPPTATFSMNWLTEATNCRSRRIGISRQIASLIDLRNHESRRMTILGRSQTKCQRRAGQCVSPAEGLSLSCNGHSGSVVFANFDLRSMHRVPSSQVRGALPVAGSKGRRPGRRLHPWGRRFQ